MTVFRPFTRFLCQLIAWTTLSFITCAAEERTTRVIEPPVAFRTSLESITNSELLDYVTFLADDAREGREAGKVGGLAAGDYLLEEISSMGLKPGGPDNEYVQTFRNGMRNILAILPGSDPELAKETVVVGAHYDHVGFGRRGSKKPNPVVYNGANDNASGTAGVLEIAEAMCQLPKAPRRSVLFALWDGEEKGLLGSKHYVENPTVDLDGVVFAIGMDMIGRINEDRFVIWGTGTAVGLREIIARNNVVSNLDLDFRIYNLTRSDHQPFFVKDIPAILPSSGLFPELHRPTDDVELIDSDGMRRASQLIYSLTYELANRDERLKFAEVSKTEAHGNPMQLTKAPTPRDDDAGFAFGFTCQREPREPNAAIVVRVAADTPAALAGLREADRVFRVDGTGISQLDAELSNLNDLTRPIELSIERNGRFHTLTLDPEAGTPRVPSQADSETVVPEDETEDPEDESGLTPLGPAGN